MKKLFLSVAMLFICLLTQVQAQTEFTTYSSCDTNTNGEVNVEDVTNTTNKVLQKTATETNVVTADQLNTILSEINAKLDKLSVIESRLSNLETANKSLKESNYNMEEKLGVPHTENSHEYVDLGLSVKWATCNVGATNPEDYGLYFAWGETTGYTSDTSDGRSFDWADYKYCNGSHVTITKYCDGSYAGTVDNLTTLEASDDAAYVNWGGSWRMPTNSELDELRSSCYWEWTSSYKSTGIRGYIVYKVKSDSDKGVKKYSGSSTTPTGSYTTSDTHIFLPAAGKRLNSSLEGAGSSGYYWTSSLFPYGPWNADMFDFSRSFVDDSANLGDNRCYGQSVRPVCQ